jgi:hypothetical protein
MIAPSSPEFCTICRMGLFTGPPNDIDANLLAAAWNDAFPDSRAHWMQHVSTGRG